MENRCVSRALEKERCQRVFRDTIVQSLLRPLSISRGGGSTNNRAVSYIRITRGH
jgi:hypothetical protein